MVLPLSSGTFRSFEETGATKKNAITWHGPEPALTGLSPIRRVSNSFMF